jgi:CSLREA domain-containing protein
MTSQRGRVRFCSGLSLIFVTGLLIGLLGVAGRAATILVFTVNANDDQSGSCTAGHCSLRQAIQAVNSNSSCTFLAGTGPLCQIAFNLPRNFIFFNGVPIALGLPSPIAISSALPVISRPVTIDGTTQSGFAGAPVVVVNASSSFPFDGLVLNGGNTTVRGLSLNKFVNAILIASSSNTIAGNNVGTTSANTNGVTINVGNNNTIGGLTAADRNVVSGNVHDGIDVAVFAGNSASGTKIQGNFIGTTTDGTSALANGSSGVDIGSFAGVNNVVGGTASGAGNLIAFNTGSFGGTGVLIDSVSSGNAVRANSIFSNGGPGINSNGLQSAPTITSSTTGAIITGSLSGGLTITPVTTLIGTVNGIANSTVALDFFDSEACDPSGFGEGQRFVGTVSTATDSSGQGAFHVSWFQSIALATMTATSTANNTSGFSNCKFASSSGSTGTFELTPTDTTVQANDRVLYTFRWTVPPSTPSWHDLATLDLRFRGLDETILQLRWDALTNTFSFYNEARQDFGPSFAPESANMLETDSARLYLADSTVRGSGPTNPTVTLTLSLGFKPSTRGETFLIEVAASDDLGHEDPFMPAGVLRVEDKH